jgi:Ca-activated chloride channel family protein
MRKIIAGILALACFDVARGQNRDYSPEKHRSAIKVDVNLVTINVTVTDRNNRTQTGLTRTDFRVWEDRVEQKIVSFDAEEMPASVGIILDVSQSMKRKASAEGNAIAALLKNSNAEDEYFVVEFNDHPRLVQKFTSDIFSLQASLTNTRFDGMTAMYDAMYLAAQQFKSAHRARKALLLITDGEDNDSRYSLNELREFLKETDIQIYPIDIVEDQSDEINAERTALQELADISGGRAFFLDSARELDGICSKIAIELKTQYVIGYESTNEAKGRKWRKVRVGLQPSSRVKHLQVRARSGYYPSAE